ARPSKACGIGMAAPSRALISRVKAVISLRVIRFLKAASVPILVPAETPGIITAVDAEETSRLEGNKPRWLSSWRADLRSSASMTPAGEAPLPPIAWYRNAVIRAGLRKKLAGFRQAT